jgi:3-oxoadipate enol-lactonase
MSLPGLTRQSIFLNKFFLIDARIKSAHDSGGLDSMPMIDADGCLLNVSVEGRDGGPTLMLSNSLGSTMAMWEPQMKAFTQLFRVIRYDRRGHGKSGAPPGPYSMERFGRDVLAILDDLNIEKTHWCGLSMGGMVGQWLGANAPERFGKLVLANTSCYYPDPTRWLERIKAVKDGGIASVADAVMAGWLTADFREREPQLTQNLKAMMIATPAVGYIACCEALSTLDQRALLPKIKSPTLVVAGRHDMSTPVAAGEFIRSHIPGASMTILDAAHISNIEQPHAFTDAVVGFLTQK